MVIRYRALLPRLDLKHTLKKTYEKKIPYPRNVQEFVSSVFAIRFLYLKKKKLRTREISTLNL